MCLDTNFDLIVMRACNGCRKRKIKCDAATNNTWPCSACTRLKLVCVPPSIGQESDFPTNQGPETNAAGPVSTNVPETSLSSFHMTPAFGEGSQPSLGSVPSYTEMGIYPQFVPSAAQQANIYDSRPSQMSVPQHSYHQSQIYAPARPRDLENNEGDVFGENDQSTAENLSEVLGELKIDETGIGITSWLSRHVQEVYSLSNSPIHPTATKRKS